jgi:hypothetical protein
MIRLRCPHHGCTIEVADDMLGARIRCPHCDQLLFVDPQHQQSTSPPPSDAVTSNPRAGESADVAQSIAEGLPPLAVLLGIREGRGRDWKDTGAARANMTELDWKALAAFEQILHATLALRTALGFGIAAVVVSLLFHVVAAQAVSWEAAFTPNRVFIHIATLPLLAIGFALMEVGRHRLPRVRLGLPIALAVLASLAVAEVFAVNIIATLEPLISDRYQPELIGPALLATPLQLLAAFFAVVACVRVQRAQTQASPHAVRHRLEEALRVLEQLDAV